jgi:Tfp pilus assembly protein PilO
LIAIVVIVVWIVTIGYYFYISRQQTEIREDLERLREMLRDEE